MDLEKTIFSARASLNDLNRVKEEIDVLNNYKNNLINNVKNLRLPSILIISLDEYRVLKDEFKKCIDALKNHNKRHAELLIVYNGLTNKIKALETEIGLIKDPKNLIHFPKRGPSGQKN